jgi:hypothetical protein
MSDDLTKRDNRDRSHLLADEDYQVALFARQNGIHPQQVHDLIKQVGNRREDLIKAAKALGKRS